MSHSPIIFGADYYPEQWDRSRWEDDAIRMREMGLTAIRIMEFAWILLEPQRGTYDFSLFDSAIEAFACQGIKSVLGTPTATPPIWLYEQDPGIMQVYLDGTVRNFGTRRQCCFNSSTYVDASMRIVEKLAQHYHGNENILGWQVDNELGHEGSDICVCDNCLAVWHQWLENKYGNIDDLNRIWGTTFWGTRYSNFTQVPAPRKQLHLIQNPSLVLDYYRFQSNGIVAFARNQVELLRKHIQKTVWITHNLYTPSMSTVIDDEELFREMDLVGYNNYPSWGDMDEPLPYFFTSSMLSYIRGLKDCNNFAIFEQYCGQQAHTCLGYLPPEEQMVLWTNQAIAHGANKIFYFRWRTAESGQEQLCYGLHDPDGSPTYRANALARNIRENRESHDHISNSSLNPEACMIYDADNARLLRDQYLSKSMYFSPVEFVQAGYDLEAVKYFAPFAIFNVTAEIKSPRSVDLDRYKVITLPLYQLADPEFVNRLAGWVSKGGHLVIGWRAGTRHPDNRAIDTELPGLLSDLAGVRVKRFESLNETRVKIRLGFIPAKGEVWADLLEPKGAKVLARYCDRKKFYRGTPAITVNSCGIGKVYYLGTSPNTIGIFFLYRRILKKAGVNPKFHGVGLEVIHRKTQEGGAFRVILNHRAKRKRIGIRSIPAYGMRILKS